MKTHKDTHIKTLQFTHLQHPQFLLARALLGAVDILLYVLLGAIQVLSQFADLVSVCVCVCVLDAS